MNAGEDPIRIVGLVEFQRALKALDGESQKRLKVVLDDAARTVAQGASRRVPRRTGRAAASLRAQSSQREAKVVGGSKKVPYYGWLDFGGTVGRGRVSSHVAKKKAVVAGKTHRAWIGSGRYMYPAYAANRDSINKALQNSLTQLVRDVGLEVTDGG